MCTYLSRKAWHVVISCVALVSLPRLISLSSVSHRLHLPTRNVPDTNTSPVTCFLPSSFTHIFPSCSYSFLSARLSSLATLHFLLFPVSQILYHHLFLFLILSVFPSQHILLFLRLSHPSVIFFLLNISCCISWLSLGVLLLSKYFYLSVHVKIC